MSFDTGWASLHAGLIQRVRPARPAAAPHPAAPAIRPVPATPAPTPAPSPAAYAPPPAPAIRPVPAALVPAPEPNPAAAPHPQEHRFGLTVRVGWRVRTLLFRIRRKTGRTTQSILHDALVQYLASVEGGAAQR